MSHSPYKSPAHNLPTTEDQYSINGVHVPETDEPVVAYPDPNYLHHVSSLAKEPPVATIVSSTVVVGHDHRGSSSASNLPHGYPRPPASPNVKLPSINGVLFPEIAEPVVAYPDLNHPHQVSSLAEEPPVATAAATGSSTVVDRDHHRLSSSASNPPHGYPKSPASPDVKPPSGCCSHCSIL